jgi:hypothetical protein
MHPSAAGSVASSPPPFCGEELFSFTSDAEGSEVFIAEEVDGLGGKRLGDNAVEILSRLVTIFLKYSSIRISCESAS